MQQKRDKAGPLAPIALWPIGRYMTCTIYLIVADQELLAKEVGNEQVQHSTISRNLACRVCGGVRNPYDIAFGPDGELFTYDADMEMDIGTPWYRPTRVCYLASGGDYGWRTGSGKWPKYYADSLPPAVEIGLAQLGVIIRIEHQRPVERLADQR